MSYLLDTCVISEFTKAKPNASVLTWLGSQKESELFISVITLGELAWGMAQRPEGKKKHRLTAWLEDDFYKRFQSRLLDVSPAVAQAWGRQSGRLKRDGINSGMADGIIAATASVHGVILVTRNTKDFDPFHLTQLNPWEN